MKISKEQKHALYPGGATPVTNSRKTNRVSRIHYTGSSANAVSNHSGLCINFFIAAFCLLFSIYNPASCFSQERAKPNIIIFLVDDMGWKDIDSFPNFKKLTQAGIQFTDAYATPLCTPTRVSLITGSNAARHGVTNWTNPDKDTSTDYPDSVFHAVDWNLNGLGLASGENDAFTAIPLPLLLKEQGYRTILAGKAL